MNPPPSKKVLIREVELRELAATLLGAAGASPAQARSVAEVLVWSDLVGRPSQGVWRLPILAERLRRGGIRGDAEPRFARLGSGVGVVHGGGGAGHHVAQAAMAHAIALAQENGVGTVTALHSNYLGPGAFYVHQAAQAGMLGLAASNSFPKVLAHGGRRPALGTNPLAFGAPRANGEALLIDMATSELAGSTLRRAAEAGKSPGEAALQPFGGAKGYALAVMVEVLCGVLAGPGLAASVNSMYEQPGRAGDNGHFMLAIDIARFLPLAAYYERIEALAAWLESTGEPGVVRLPGAARWRARDEQAALGIALEARTAAALERLCHELHVDLPVAVQIQGSPCFASSSG